MSAQYVSRRRLAVAVLTASALVATVAGCGGPALLDPTDEQLAADRARLVDDMTRGLMAAGDQLGAGPALATRVDSSCSAGTNNWKIHDTYRSTCRVTVHGGFALDVDLNEALGGLEGLTAFQERMEAEGWCRADWGVVGNDPGAGVDVDWIREHGRPVTDVTGVRFASNRAELRVGFMPGSEPVPTGLRSARRLLQRQSGRGLAGRVERRAQRPHPARQHLR